MFVPTPRPSGWFGVFAIVAAGIAITFGAYRWAAEEENAAARAEFNAAADAFGASVAERLRGGVRLIHTLAAARRLFSQSDAAGVDALIRELDLDDQYPGFLAAGDIQAQTPKPGETPRWRIAHAEPPGVGGRGVPGFDAAADARLRAMLERARDGGGAVVSAHAGEAFGIAPAVVFAHALYDGPGLPADPAARRLRLRGFVFVLMDARRLAEDAAGRLPPAAAGRLLAKDAAGGGLLYDSRQAGHAVHETRRFVEAVEGELFAIEVAATRPLADAADRHRSRLVLILGASTTLLLATIVWLFAAGSAWAEVRARRLAEAYRVSEARYALATETTTDGIWERDLASGETTVSPRFEILLGREAGSCGRDGIRPEDLAHPDDRQRLADLATAASRQEGPSLAEVRMKHADGHYLWVRLRARIQRDADGRPQRLIGSLADISDLRTAIERFRDLSQMASDGFWEQDGNLRFMAISDSLRHSPTAGAGLSIGQTLWELPLAVDAEVMADYRAAAAEQREFRDFEYGIEGDDGRRYWFSLSGRPMFDADGSFIGYRGTSRDITVAKQLEDELRTHRDNLTMLVDAQTADLVRAKDDAEQASRAKSDFLANMSHELRTPMHAILSFARLGSAKAAAAPPEKLQEYFERVRTSGERLLELVNNLLDLSKLDAGKMHITAVPVDLGRLVAEVAHDLEGMFEARHLHFDFPPPECDTRVVGDPARLGQVVRNLISNAVKFTPEGGSVRIAFADDELPGGRRAEDRGTLPAVRMTVADEGIGIPEDELEAIFDKFYQSSKTRTGAGGTGLGLAICREIVAAHRGRIVARNLPEGGAAVDVLLRQAADKETRGTP